LGGRENGDERAAQAIYLSTDGPEPEGLHDTRDAWLGVGFVMLTYLAAGGVAVALRISGGDPKLDVGRVVADAVFAANPAAAVAGAVAGVVALVRRQWAVLFGLSGGVGLIMLAWIAAGFLLPHEPPPVWNGLGGP